jgi:DNA modification methylase
MLYWEQGGNKIYHGHVLNELRSMEAKSVHCCVTSPPYWGLRNYDTPAQVWGDSEKSGAWFGSYGLEPTPELFVEHTVEVFREVRRVLRDDGTLWLNLGDSYFAGGGSTEYGQNTQNFIEKSSIQGGYTEGQCSRPIKPKKHPNLKPKNLVGIPWRVALALQADGCADIKAVQVLERVMSEIMNEYVDEPIPDKVLIALERLKGEWTQAKGDSWYLRQDIIWHKKNPMPESVKDRCTKSHEYIFLLSKSPKYYFDADAIKEKASPESHARYARGRSSHHKYADGGPGNQSIAKSFKHMRKPGVNPKAAMNAKGSKQNASFSAAIKDIVEYRNKRSVWSIPTKGVKGAHFATFPTAL